MKTLNLIPDESLKAVVGGKKKKHHRVRRTSRYSGTSRRVVCHSQRIIRTPSKWRKVRSSRRIVVSSSYRR